MAHAYFWPQDRRHYCSRDSQLYFTRIWGAISHISGSERGETSALARLLPPLHADLIEEVGEREREREREREHIGRA